MRWLLLTGWIALVGCAVDSAPTCNAGGVPECDPASGFEGGPDGVDYRYFPVCGSWRANCTTGVLSGAEGLQCDADAQPSCSSGSVECVRVRCDGVDHGSDEP
jgi:hypothetical protein